MLYQPVHDLLIFTLWIRYDVRENNLQASRLPTSLVFGATLTFFTK